MQRGSNSQICTSRKMNPKTVQASSSVNFAPASYLICSFFLSLFLPFSLFIASILLLSSPVSFFSRPSHIWLVWGSWRLQHGWVGGSISREDCSSNESYLREQRDWGRRWKLSEAKTTRMKTTSQQQQQFATVEFFPSSQITVTHWFFLLPLPPLAVVPSCHPPSLFLATFIHVFVSFQVALHVPDMSRCSHPPRSFKFTPRLIFSPIGAAHTAILSRSPRQWKHLFFLKSSSLFWDLQAISDHLFSLAK